MGCRHLSLVRRAVQRMANYTIPPADRAGGEPASGGMPPLQYAEAVAERDAPEMLRAYRAERAAFPAWAWEQKRLDGAFSEQPITEREDRIHAMVWPFLHADLAAGKAICFAYSVQLGHRVRVISAHLFMFTPRGGAVAPNGTGFLDTRIYPAGEGEPEIEAEPEPQSETAKLQAEARRRLQDEAQSNAPRATKKDCWWKILEKEIDGLSRRQFDLAWSKAALPEAWRKPGPRKKIIQG
jgi:hypothetical protein